MRMMTHRWRCALSEAIIPDHSLPMVKPVRMQRASLVALRRRWLRDRIVRRSGRRHAPGTMLSSAPNRPSVGS
jgi:hypothetical protein